MAQLDPGELAIVAGIEPKVSRQVQILEPQAFLRDVDQVSLPGCQFLEPQRFAQVRQLGLRRGAECGPA